METIDEKLVSRFLLGELTEENRLQFEERFFKDDRFYEQVLAIQEELADDYVHNKLSRTERTHFENVFLQSPRRRQRVEFAAAFTRALEGTPSLTKAEPVTTWWESLFSFINPKGLRLTTALASAAAVLVLAGAIWLFVENRRLASDVEQARAEKESLLQQSTLNEAEAEQKRQELERDIAALRLQGREMESAIQQKQRELEGLQRIKTTVRSTADASSIATFILPPGLTRSTDEPEKLIVPTAVRSMQLQLDLEREEDFQSYTVELRTARGNLVWSKSGIPLKKTGYGRAVLVTIPAKLVPNGEYELTLKGSDRGNVQAVGYYYFIALRR
jgi:hypothetical protein